LAILYFVGAGFIVWAAGPNAAIPITTGIWIGLFAAFQVMLMILAVPRAAFAADTSGYLSFDRLPLVAAVLIFGPVPAAWASGAAAFAWTLFADPRRATVPRRIIRAAGNAGMFALASLAAGLVYRLLSGSFPLSDLSLPTLGRILALLLTLQSVNELLYVALSWPSMSGAARRRPIDLRGALTEVVISVTGVITAIAFLSMPLAGFVLYTAFILSVAILFKRVVNMVKIQRRRAEELAAVNHVNQAVSGAADLDDIIETIFSELSGLMDFAALIIGVYDRGANEIDVRLNYDEGIRHKPSRRKPGEGLLAWTLEHQEAVFVADNRRESHPSMRHSVIIGRPPVSIIAIPINFQNETVGVISAQDYRPGAFDHHHLELLRGFANQVAVAIVNTRLFSELRAHQTELERRVASRTAALERTTASLKDAVATKETLLARLEQENRRDPLTRLANRRYLDETLKQELRRVERFGHTLTIAMCDIDHFKRVNDSLGHGLGDEVLRAIASILGTELRATDFVARYGGEEFVILFPETGVADALAACEKLRRLIADYAWERISPALAVTMSFGLAALADPRQTPAQLLASADRALYQAKRSGRNLVCEPIALPAAGE